MARPRGGGAYIPLAYQGATHPIVRVRIVYGPTQHYAGVAAYVTYVAYLANHGKGEGGGPASVRMVYRGSVHLLACKWLYTAGAPTVPPHGLLNSPLTAVACPYMSQIFVRVPSGV